MSKFIQFLSNGKDYSMIKEGIIVAIYILLFSGRMETNKPSGNTMSAVIKLKAVCRCNFCKNCP